MNDRSESRMVPSRDRLLRRGLKLTHLRLLATLAETGKISASAAHLAMSQPAASRLLAELDTIVGAGLYQRHPRGVVLTEFGERFASWAQKVLRDLDAADREIIEMGAGDRGLVTIGSVTGPALELVLPVLRQIRVTHPGISADIVVDTSDRLAEMLLIERADFYIGRIPQDVDPRAFHANLIGEEPVSLIVRENHPLIRSGSTALVDCVIYDWVLQAPSGLLRHTVETYLLERGFNLPNRVISTSSMLMTLALISQSNAIAPISRAVAEFFGGSEGIGGRIATLPVAADLVVSPYSILRPAGRPLSPASQIVHDLIHDRAMASAG
ncbi:LysR substrate-binding domain-containing protein [Mesorhizobium sp. SB112]|uniref:LysR family transcriptional regulator n=1 Tax=Mesorhizobium sp. SB112 TaxID=3151853 RepID=UPI0032633F37